jgi:hypothetical protein
MDQQDSSAPTQGHPGRPTIIVATPPVLKSETPTLSWSADKFGSIKLTYASWEDAKMVLKGQVMHIRWGDQGVEARIIPDDLLMAAVQKSMLAMDSMTARLDTLTEEIAALKAAIETVRQQTHPHRHATSSTA